MTAYTRTHTLSNAVSADLEKITKTLNVLQRKLKQVTHDWWQLGLQLKQQPSPLDGFKANPEKDSIQTKFAKMLQYWLNTGEGEYRTWGALAKAVDDLGNKALGTKIRNSKHYREHSAGRSKILCVFLCHKFSRNSYGKTCAKKRR